MKNTTKKVGATVKYNETEIRVSFEHYPLTDPEYVSVWTKSRGLGKYLISRFGDGETLNREWVRDFFDDDKYEIVKWG